MRDGVFTPGGNALCVACHDANWTDATWFKKIIVARTEEELDALLARGEEAVGPCEDCGRDCVLRPDVARLSRLAKRLDAMLRSGTGVEGTSVGLAQTGGMCVALELCVEECVVVVTVEDPDNDYNVGLYTKTSWYDDGNGECVEQRAATEANVYAVIGDLFWKGATV
jgi:hypothetical protein